MTGPRNLQQRRRRRRRKVRMKTTTTTTDASPEDIRHVQGIEDNEKGGIRLTTSLVDWQRQQSVDFLCVQVANSNTNTSRFLVLIFFHQIPFFPFTTWNTISTKIMRKIFLYKMYTNLAYVPPTYRRVNKRRYLIINKDIHKSIASKNVNNNPIWSWNNSID